MALNMANWAVVAGLIAAGCGLTYAGMRRALRRTDAERQQETERQLKQLADAIKVLEAQLDLQRQQAELLPAAAVAIDLQAAASTTDETVFRGSEEIAPEILVVIAAAATAFLRSNVRIRSAKMLPSPYGGPSPWSQQGRVFVQSSHNLRSRG